MAPNVAPPNGRPRPLRVLVVEDSIPDAELVVAELRRAGFAPEWRRVDNEDGYAAHLDPSLDVILCDYRLPAFDPFGALELLQARGLDIPLIVISGTIGEDLAVDALHRGVTDYLLKDRLGRLGQAVARALSERRLREEKRQSEEHYRTLAEAARDHIFIVNRDGVLKYVNTAAAEEFGVRAAEIVGKRLEELFPPDVVARQRDNVERVFITATPLIVEERIPYPSGDRWVNTRIVPLRSDIGEVRAVLGIARDLTEQKILEEEFRQSQKMEAIGRLAGGVAHDFNNLLTAILGFSQFLLDQAGANEPMRRDIEEIRRAGQSAAALTQQLLAFGRKQVLQPRVVDLNEVIADADKLLRRVIGEDIQFTTRPATNLLAVTIDPNQMVQVILNLAVNARDAMPDGGQLTIETANVSLDQSYAQDHRPVVPGRYVMVAVSDTGHGMDAQTQSHLFEPFFTTKELGKGTGLGLATVYGIVKQSGGYIWVYSEVNRGTTFKIYLPVAEEHAAAAAEPMAGVVVGGTETILLVEDADSVRALAQQALERHGYRVLPARNGREALEMVERQTDRIHLVLTDVVMPEMSGRELAEQVMAKLPGTRILYTSGYTDDAVVQHGVLEDRLAFLQKPFAPDELARKVREMLDTPDPNPGGVGGTR